jgi:hypothetical protein
MLVCVCPRQTPCKTPKFEWNLQSCSSIPLPNRTPVGTPSVYIRNTYSQANFRTRRDINGNCVVKTLSRLFFIFYSFTIDPNLDVNVGLRPSAPQRIVGLMPSGASYGFLLVQQVPSTIDHEKPQFRQDHVFFHSTSFNYKVRIESRSWFLSYRNRLYPNRMHSMGPVVLVPA